MTIHSSHPFALPDDAIRRLRGRLGTAVSLWTAGEGPDRAGIPVTSFMVANGSPGAIIALVMPDSAFAGVFEETGRAVVQLLQWQDRELADIFAGELPWPGGPFRRGQWQQIAAGPLLQDRSFATVRWRHAQEVGWSLQIVAEIEQVELLPDQAPLAHRRGKYYQP